MSTNGNFTTGHKNTRDQLPEPSRRSTARLSAAPPSATVLFEHTTATNHWFGKKTSNGGTLVRWLIWLPYPRATILSDPNGYVKRYWRPMPSPEGKNKGNIPTKLFHVTTQIPNINTRQPSERGDWSWKATSSAWHRHWTWKYRNAASSISCRSTHGGRGAAASAGPPVPDCDHGPESPFFLGACLSTHNIK